jgi:hypothetical protein
MTAFRMRIFWSSASLRSGLLEEAFLVASLRRSARDPDRAHDPVRFGARVENACLAYAWNAGQRVTYWREEPVEADAILEGSWGKWATEVKTGSVSSVELRGLAEFIRRHKAYCPIIPCEDDQRDAVARIGFTSMSWAEFLLQGSHS